MSSSPAFPVDRPRLIAIAVQRPADLIPSGEIADGEAGRSSSYPSGPGFDHRSGVWPRRSGGLAGGLVRVPVQFI